MPCNLFTYQGRVYTSQNLHEALMDPASHDSIFWQLYDDQLKSVKSLKEDINGFYKDIFDGNEKEIMYEAAVQANSSQSEKEGALKVFGPRIVQIAQDVFPHAQVGDTYTSAVSREVKQVFAVTPQNDNVNFQLRIVEALSSPKVDSLYNRFYKKGDFDKFYFELLVYAGKQQVDLLREWNHANNPQSLQEMATGILANMSQVVTVKTAMEKDQEIEMDFDLENTGGAKFVYNGDRYTSVLFKDVAFYYKNEKNISEEEFLKAHEQATPQATRHYATLTVPGGTNYTENEIATPGIVPSIKGHAAFSTENGIGWFRSDEQRSDNNTGDKVYDGAGGLVQEGQVGSKTRRVLEMQSDLFQKGRNQEVLIFDQATVFDKSSKSAFTEASELGTRMTDTADSGVTAYEYNGDVYIFDHENGAYSIRRDTYRKGEPSNQFLQLFNKDNGWVSFFLKAIIQDSAKKGYEKVLFPTGDTAARVEGHQTIEGYVAERRNRLKEIEKNLEPQALESKYQAKLKELKDALKRLKQRSGKPVSVNSAPYDFYISPVLTGTNLNYSRLRKNMETTHGPDFAFDFVDDRSYTGWVLQNYSVGEPHEARKVTADEAQDLLNKDFLLKHKGNVEEVERLQEVVDDLIDNKEEDIGLTQNDLIREQDHVELEIEQALAGTLRISSVAKFYEKDIFNVLKKKGYEPNRITDEYGNQWYEVDVRQTRDLSPISFNEKSFEDIMMARLQNLDIAGKKKFANEYWVKKTATYVPSNQYQPQEIERRNLEKIVRINEKMGYDAIHVRQKGNGYIIRINPQLRAFNELETIFEEWNPPEDIEQISFDQIYGAKTEPVTTDVLRNIATLARDLGREDLIEMARFAYQYLKKNEGLKIQLVTELESADLLGSRSPEKTAGVFNAATNSIRISMNMMQASTVEGNVEIALEEILHGISVQPLIKRYETLNANEKQYVDDINRLFDSYKRRTPEKLRDRYRFINAREFIIGMTMDKDFQRLAQNTNSRKNPANRTGNFFTELWRDFIDAVRNLLRMPSIKRPNQRDFEADRASMITSLRRFLDNSTSVALNASLAEQGRDYDLSFAVVTKSSIEAQKANVEAQILSEDYKDEFKKRVRTLVNSLRANSNLMNAIEADENFIFLFKEARKLNEDVIDEVQYLFSFINEFSAMTDLAVRMTREVRDNKESNDIKIKRFNNIGNSISQFGSIIGELEQIREVVLIDTPLGQTLDKILSNVRTVATLINTNMKPLVANKMVALAGPAAEMAVKEIRDKIDTLTKHLAGARQRNQTGRVKELERKIAIQQKFLEEKLTITPQYANDVLSGIYGDSHMLSAWMEPMIVNPNLAPASVAKATTDAYNRLAPDIADNNNAFQSAIDKYAKATGRNINNIKEFTDPFIQVVSKVKSMKDDGTFEMEQRLALVNPYNLDYIQEIQKFNFKKNALLKKIGTAGTEEKKADLIREYKSLLADRKQFMKDYMEQEFKEEVYEAMELMDVDLGGFTAREVTSEIYDNKSKSEKDFDAAESEAEMDKALEQIAVWDFAIKRLRYNEGRDPESKEYKVAEQLKKYDAAMKKYRTYDITHKSLLKFEREKQRTDQLFEDKAISEKARDHWYQKNTVTEYTEEYWETRKQLHEELQALRDKLGISKEEKKDINDLYRRIETIVKAYRDNTGKINGLEVPKEEAALVKELEMEIDALKEEVANIYGLTKSDRNELTRLSKLEEELGLEIHYTFNTPDFNSKRAQLLEVQNEIEKILLGRKKVNKQDAKAYLAIIGKLADLNKTTTTEYYEDAKEAEIDKIMGTINLTALPDLFYVGNITYMKHGDIWVRKMENGTQTLVDNISEVEQAYLKNVAKARLPQSQWWTDNHITRNKWIEDGYQEIEDPIYIWKHTSPKIAGYIKNDQPSFKYKRVGIKSEFRNENYRDTPDGYNRPKIVGAKDDRYINKEYRRLGSSADPKDKATFETLKFLIDKHTESQSRIPINYRLGYILPSIRKKDIERIQAGDTKEKIIGKIKGLGKSIAEDLTENEQDKDILFGYNESMTSIPVKHIGDIDIKDQTRDIFRSILMFSSEALKRKSLMDALPFVLGVRNILKAEENKPVKLDSKGKVITLLKKFGGDKFVAKLIPGESASSKQVNEYIRTYYFGENIKDEPGAKQINTLLGYGAKALLGLNYSASIVNRLNAMTQSLLESEFNMGVISFKNVMHAQMIYDQHVMNGAYISDIGKYGNKSKLTQMFDYFGGSNFNIIDKQDKSLAYSKLIQGVGKILIPNEMAEHAIANQLFIAMALEEKVQQGNVRISLYDAFEITGNRIGLKKGVEFSETQRLNFIGRMNAAARRINGNYNKLDKVQAQKYAIGRCLLFMNNYFTPFLTRRFGYQRFSIEEGVTQEGYWRTFGSILRRDVLSFQRSAILGWKYYTPQERAAVTRTATEMGVSMLAIGLIALLGGGEPDQLADNGYWQNNAIYILKMFRRQNEQFMLVPGLGLDDIYQKLKSPFPIMGKLGNIASMLNHAIYQAGYTAGFGGREADFLYTRKSGWHQKGDYKILTDLSRLFGFTYRFSQMSHPEVAIKNMDAYRIK